MMSRTISIARLLFSIMTLKAGPQDLPFSHQLLNVMIILYVISGLVVLQGNMDDGLALMHMVVDVIIMLFYTFAVLQLLDRKPRFVQTMIAMIGTGICFHVIAWPLLAQTEMVDGQQMLSAGASLVMLFVIGWNLAVNAHIFRQALEFGVGSAILLSFALFFISLAVSQSLLPQP